MKEVFLALILIVCAWTDWKFRKIYNLIIGPGIVIALIFAGVSDSWGGLANSFIGLIIGILLLLIPFIMGGIGAGDVKLLGLVGAFNGPIFVFEAFLGTALIGGLMAALLLLVNKEFTRVGKNMLSTAIGIFFCNFSSLSYETKSVKKLPYGIAIALGTLVVYWVR